MIYTFQVNSNEEWFSLKSFLPVTAIMPTPHGESFFHIINNIECVFFHGGTSKTKSSASCQYAIDKWKPKYHFLIGTAGGIANNLKELDIIIANKTGIYDYIFRMGEPYELIPKETVVCIDNSWIDFSKLSKNILEGFIATADQDVDYATKLKLQSEKVLAADWESGAVSLICKINDIPCCIIRGITDIPLDTSEENAKNQGLSYTKNTPLIMRKILKEILFVIL